MRRKLLCGFLILIIIICIPFFFYKKNNLLKTNNSLINISELSESFMQNYFEEVAALDEDNKENILIVTSLDGINKDYGASKIVEAPNHQYFLQFSSSLLKEKAFKEIESDNILVEENVVRYYNEVLETAYNSWGIEAMGLDYAITSTSGKTLNDVTVAIIDSGCNMDLFNQNYSGKIEETYNVLSPGSAMSDENGHGTHIAGTIAEGTPDNVKIMPVKVGGADNTMATVDIITGINYIVYYEKADVINMSFGSPVYTNAEYEAIEAAYQKNIICVASAGNDNTSNANYPSALPTTISIASVDSNLNKSSFSNYGDTIDFAAPGSSILSINGTKSGTSMAAPHATSAVAILKSYNKNLSQADVITLLKEYSVDLGYEGWDQYYGYGFINFNGATFCDSINCDDYNVYGSDAEDELPIIKMEGPTGISVSTYNYRSYTNLMDIWLKLYYTNDLYFTKKLKELDGYEIINYDPNTLNEQLITINYKGLSTNVRVMNTSTNGWNYNVLGDGTVSLTELLYYTDYPEVIYIPEQIDGYNVSALDTNLFYNKTNLVKVFIPEGIKTINQAVFNRCTSLNTVTLPNSLKSIGKNAFANTKALKNINLPSGLTFLAERAFYASGITSVTIPSGITELYDNTFYNCKNLEEVVFNNTLTSIGASVFASDEKLDGITLPNTLTTIGDFAFDKTGLTSISVPGSVVSIGKFAFRTSSLLSLELNDGLQSIGEGAFNSTNMSSVHIPKTVNSIGTNPFEANYSLSSIVVDENNVYYDSRDNSNAIIETETDTLVTGVTNSILPSSLKVIGKEAITTTSDTIIIPEGVVELKENSIVGALNSELKTVVLPKSLTTIHEYALDVYIDSYVTSLPENALFWVYSNSYSNTFAVNNSINYRIIEPQNIEVTLPKETYSAFEQVDLDNVVVSLTYSGKTSSVSNNISNLSIDYNDNESLKYGDTSVTLSFLTEIGYPVETEVNVNVVKINPTYTVPDDLTLIIGDKLSKITLPSGFSWINGDTIVSETGLFNFKARYTPEDTNNYNTIDNIDIPILVTKNIITDPGITISDKEYDGTNTILNSDITISNLNENDYTITSIETSNINIGVAEATITIRLTNEYYNNYSFQNDAQEKSFVVNYTITPKIIEKPTKSNNNYVYTSEEITFAVNNYDANYMSISGNKGTDAGNYDVIISLNNNNYVWSDNTTQDVILGYEIKKASIIVNDLSSDVTIKYDGNPHSVNMSIALDSNMTLKYMDDNNLYTLDEAPSYKNLGTHVIKYKVYINNNYEEYNSEKTLTINSNQMVNNSFGYEGVYDGNDHTISINITPNNYEIRYSIDNTDYDLTELPSFKNVGEHVINYKVTAYGYDDLEGSNTIKIYGISNYDDALEVKEDNFVVGSNSFSELAGKINTYSISRVFKHLNKDGDETEDNSIKTGDILRVVINDNKNYDYHIAYLGDTSGDGKINYLDYVNVYNHIQKVKHPELNKTLLVDEYLLAADMSGDNKISYLDYVRIYNKIKELKGGTN